MDAIIQLNNMISPTTLFIVLVLTAVAFKFLSELISWFYTKLKTYFYGQSEDAKKEDEQKELLTNILEQITQIQENISSTTTRIIELSNKLEIIEERLQDETRAYIIEKHHYYVYVMRSIDDMGLQDLERRYMYYKAGNGNTFIDNLMAEIRQLPRRTLDNTLSVIQPKKD